MQVHYLMVHQVGHTWGTKLVKERVLTPIETLDEPVTLDHAVALVSAGATPIAGGTDLLVRRDQGLGGGAHLVSLTDVEELLRIESPDLAGFKFGGAVTLERLIAATSGSLPVVAQAAEGIASPQIRSEATLGGNLLQEKRCWFYRNGFNCYKGGQPVLAMQ